MLAKCAGMPQIYWSSLEEAFYFEPHLQAYWVQIFSCLSQISYRLFFDLSSDLNQALKKISFIGLRLYAFLTSACSYCEPYFLSLVFKNFPVFSSASQLFPRNISLPLHAPFFSNCAFARILNCSDYYRLILKLLVHREHQKCEVQNAKVFPIAFLFCIS